VVCVNGIGSHSQAKTQKLFAFAAADAYNMASPISGVNLPGIRQYSITRCGMLSLVRVVCLAVVCLLFVEVARAQVALPAAASVPSVASAGLELPLVVGQYSGDSSSSSGSTRIPRGIIKLGIFVVIGLFSVGAWVIKKMTAG
jgi:hypothetical protein